MRKTIFFLGLLGLFASLFAQVPGHMGRRWMLGMNVGVSPILYGNAGDLQLNQSIADVVLITPEIHLSHAFSRNGVLSFSFKQSSGTGVRTFHILDESTGNEAVYYDQAYGFRMRAFALGYQNFMFKSAGRLAPNGLYFKATGGLWVANGFLQDKTIGKPVEFMQSSKALVGSVGLGYNFIPLDFLIIDVGLGLVISYPINNGRTSLYDEFNYTVRNQEIRTHLGLSYLFGGGKWR